MHSKRHHPGAGRCPRIGSSPRTARSPKNFAQALACLVVIGMILTACQDLPASATPATAPALRATSASSSGRYAPEGTAGASTPGAAASAFALPTTSGTPTPLLPETPAISLTPEPPVRGNVTTPANTITATAFPAGSSTVEQVSVPAGAVVAPILLYHHVSDKADPNRYDTGIAAFRAQMQALKKAGYETVTISRLAGVIRSGGSLPVKPIALTFDDGYLDTYENAFPILQEFGYTATVYVITGTLGTRLSYGYMQEKELKALAAAGWEIGSHSVTHTSLLTSKLGMGNELKESKEDLEKMLGITVHSFSYPFGAANKSIEALPAQYGYDSAVGLDTIITHPPSRLFYLSRREVYRGITQKQFNALLIPGINDRIIATQSAKAQTPMAP